MSVHAPTMIRMTPVKSSTRTATMTRRTCVKAEVLRLFCNLVVDVLPIISFCVLVEFRTRCYGAGERDAHATEHKDELHYQRQEAKAAEERLDDEDALTRGGGGEVECVADDAD